MPKAEGLKLEYGSEELINTDYLESFPFDSPNQYIITETDEFSAVCPFSGLPDYSYLKIEYFPEGRKSLELKSLKYYIIVFQLICNLIFSLLNRI